jgi:hypothetical protein
VLKKIACNGALDEPPPMQEQYFVSKPARLSNVVRGHHDFGALIPEHAYDRLYRMHGCGIKVRRWLIQKQDLRP